MRVNYIDANKDYVVLLTASKLIVLDFKTFMSTRNVDESLIQIINSATQITNPSPNCHYLYNDKYIRITFYGAYTIYSLTTGQQTASGSIGAINNGGSGLWWKNKVYNSTTKEVVTLPM
jgi:hypothetical protein